MQSQLFVFHLHFEVFSQEGAPFLCPARFPYFPSRFAVVNKRFPVKVNRVYGSLVGGTVSLHNLLPKISLYRFVMHALRNRHSNWAANWDREIFFWGYRVPNCVSQRPKVTLSPLISSN